MNEIPLKALYYQHDAEKIKLNSSNKTTWKSLITIFSLEDLKIAQSEWEQDKELECRHFHFVVTKDCLIPFLHSFNKQKKATLEIFNLQEITFDKKDFEQIKKSGMVLSIPYLKYLFRDCEEEWKELKTVLEKNKINYSLHLDGKFLMDGLYSEPLELTWWRAILQHIKNLNYPNDIELSLSGRDHLFWSIAKIRALKAIVEEFQLSHQLKIFYTTSLSYYSKLGEWNNFIRASLVATSAMMGGADFLYLHPPVQLSGRAELKERRITLNIFHVLNEEAELMRVNDPWRGSYFMEEITNELIHYAENYPPSSISGQVFLQSAKAQKQLMVKALEEKKILQTGVNCFISPDEILVRKNYSEEEQNYFHHTWIQK